MLSYNNIQYFDTQTFQSQCITAVRDLGNKGK